MVRGPGIADFAYTTRLAPKNLSQLDARLMGTLHAKGPGEGKAVGLCEGDRNGGTHEELPHQTACIKRSFTIDRVLEATVISDL